MQTPPDSTRLTVVVINRNTAGLLQQCLRHIQAADAGCPIETIVVDNGSTDASVAETRRDFPAVRLIVNDHNEGFAAAANRGIDSCDAPLIVLLNSDGFVQDGCLREMVAVMQRDPRIGILGALLVNADGSSQNSAANTPSLITETCKKTLLKRLMPGRYYSRHFLPDGPAEVESIVGACMMLRREMLGEIGGFDPGYFFFFEESDLCLRARAAGWRVVLAPQARCVHLQGQTAARTPVAVRIEYWRSRYRFFRKHYGWGTRLLLLAGLLINLLIDVVYFALLSPFKAKARGRLTVCLAILAWHLAGCTDRIGLRPARGSGA